MSEPQPVELRTCIVCNTQKEQGIAICEQFICSDCEREIVATDTGDVRYQHYINCMKRIWDHAQSI